MHHRSLTSLFLTMLAACNTVPPSTIPDGANSRNALDWPGVYVGTVPCADCEGIRTRIELSADGSYSRSLTYLGRDQRPFTDAGTFEWDAAGGRITLDESGRDAQQYRVGENILFHLDRDGLRVTGDLAAAYRLEKLVNDPRIEDRRWELIELNGRPVAPPAGREAVYLVFESLEARVAGNAFCNRFSGAYELTAGSRLRFDAEMGTTLMACPELDREREFVAMLARVDNYSLGDGVLSMNRARMAPLARFRAVAALSSER